MLYMLVWADKSNINCCCSEACQPTHVASTINIITNENTYKFNIQDIDIKYRLIIIKNKKNRHYCR